MLCSSNIDFKGSYCFYYSRFTILRIQSTAENDGEIQDIGIVR